MLTDNSLCSVISDNQSEEEGNGRISEYALTKPHLKAKHSRPINTQSISSLGMAAHETNEFAVSEHDEEIVEVASRALSIVMRQSEIDLDRCRAGSVAECILMLDYLLYYCLPLPLLIFTLAYVGLCSLLSKLSSVDILPSSQE